MSELAITQYKIIDLIGSYCMARQDGEKIYDLIHPELVADHPVELNFLGVKLIWPPFLNAAIGQLYKDLQPEKINRLLKISNIHSRGMQGLQLVRENSYRYYSEPKYQETVDTVMLKMYEDGQI